MKKIKDTFLAVGLVTTSKIQYLTFIALFVLFTVHCSLFTVQAQATEFTYQGRLLDSSLPATANYDFKFTLWDSLANGTQIGPDVIVDDVAVSNGIFTVRLDFTSVAFLNGGQHFIQIEVRPGASVGAYTTLAPRQPVTSSPFSIRSLRAAQAHKLTFDCTQCVEDDQINQVSGSKIIGAVANATNAVTANTSTTATTAGNVTGVVAIANGGTGSATKNFVDLTTNQTVGGTKTFTDAPVGNGSLLTNINGANITNNTINASALASDTFPNNQNLSRLGQLRWDQLGQRVSVGSIPQGVAFDGANIWVANSGSNTVTKLRASDGALQGNFAVGSIPRGVAFDGANIWVANQVSANVTKLRASDGACAGVVGPATAACTFAVGTEPYGVAFDGANIWVTNSFSDNVTKRRASDGALLETIAVGNHPLGIAFDGASIWVASYVSSTVTKLLASTNAVQGTFPAGDNPTGVAFDGANIWVTNDSGFTSAVTKLRASNGATLGTFTIDNFPLGVAFDGANIWVTSTGGTVTKLRASDGANLGTFPVGANPFGVAFDGANMWVTNSGSNNVTKLPVFP